MDRAEDIVPCQTTETRSADGGSSVPPATAYSDGVFSIAATLLVLDIAVYPPGALPQILQAWPAYLAYLVSFLTIGAAWMAHTALTHRLTRSDPILLQINLLVLLVVVFLPFPTKLVTDALHNTDAERAAVTIYGLTLLAIRALGPPWMPIRGTRISTRRQETAQTAMRSRAREKSFCRW